jgi:hypothetical protein
MKLDKELEQEWKSLKEAFQNYFNDMATDEETKRVMRYREANRKLEAQKRINKMHNARVLAEKEAKHGKTASVADILGPNHYWND